MGAKSAKRVAVIVSNKYENDLRVIREAETLSSHGYSVYVFCTAGAPNEQTDAPVTTRISVVQSTSHLPYVIRRPQEAMRYAILWRQVVQYGETFDAIHSHDLNAAVVGYWASRALNIPLICDFHELFIDYFVDPHRRPLRECVLRLYDRAWNGIGRRIAQSAAGIITVNDSLAQVYQDRWKLAKQPTVVHNFSSKVHGANKATGKGYFREKYRIGTRKKILLFQGKLFYDKGIETIVAAFKDQAEYAVVFLGFGALVEKLVEYQAKYPGVFYYHEPVRGKELVAYTRAADVGLAPIGARTGNHIYSSPNKVYEYLAAGIPFVCTDLPEMRNIVNDTGAGVLVPVDDPVALLGAVKRIFSGSDYGNMCRRAREAFDTKYCWEVEQAKLIGLYSEIL